MTRRVIMLSLIASKGRISLQRETDFFQGHAYRLEDRSIGSRTSKMAEGQAYKLISTRILSHSRLYTIFCTLRWSSLR